MKLTLTIPDHIPMLELAPIFRVLQEIGIQIHEPKRRNPAAKIRAARLNAERLIAERVIH